MADASKEIYTGAEGSAAGPYAHWATEKTLLSLCDTLKSTGVDSKDIDSLVDMIGTMSKDGKVDTVTLKGVLQNLKQEQTKSKESKKDAEEHAKKEGQFWSNSKKEARRAYQAIKSSDLTDQLGKGAEMMMLPVESISEAFVRVAGIVSSVGGIMAKWGTQIIDNIKILGKWGQGLLKGAIGFAGMIGGLATTIFAGLMGAITGLGNAFFQLYNTGINLSAGLNESQSGLGALASAAADARLTVGEFAEFVGDNARVAVAIGAAAMGQLSGSVRLALYPLGNLGLTAAETNDYLGDWLETQRSIGVLETMTRAQQAKGAADYLITLTELAQVTGKQRKQIADSIKANMQQVEVMGLMLGLPDEMKANVQRVGQSLSGILSSIDPEFATGFMEALGKGNLNMTEWGRTLKKAGFQAEANAFQGLIDQTRSGKISEEEAKVKMFAILQQMKENKGATARMNRLFRVNDMTVAGHLKMQAALEGANLQLERQDITMDKTIRTIGSWDEMQRSVSQSWTNFMKGLFNDERFTKTMGTIAESLRNLFAPDSAFSKNLRKFMEGFGPKLVDGITTFGDWIGDVNFQKYIDKLPGQIKSMGDKIFEFIDMIRGLFFKEVETGDEFAGAGGAKTTWVAKTGDEIMGNVGDAIGNMMVSVFKKLGNIILDSAANVLPGFLRPDTAEVNALQAELKAIQQSEPGGKNSELYKKKLKELEAAEARQDADREFTGTDAAVLGTTAVVGGYAAKKVYNVAKGTANVTGKVVGALTPGAGASTKKVAKEAAERAAREASEKIAKEAAEKAAKEAAEAAGKKAALKVASKVGQRAATIAATSAVGGPFAPLVAVGATIAFAGYDAYRAIEDTANIVGKTEGEAITLGDKIKAGASGVVSGLTFGMVSAKKVHDTVAGWKFWDKEDDMPATPPGIETAHLKALAGVDLSTATAQFKEFSDVIGPLGKGVNSLAVGLIKTEPEKLKLLAEGIAPFEKLDGPKLTAVGPGMESVGKSLVSVGWGGLISELADPKHLKALGNAFIPWGDLDGAKLKEVGPGVRIIASALDNVGFSGMIAKLADPVHLGSLGRAFIPWADLDGGGLSESAPGVAAINKSLPGVSEVTANLTDPVHLKGLAGAFKEFGLVNGAALTLAASGIAEINKSLPGIRDVTANLANPEHLTSLAGSFSKFADVDGAKLSLAAPGITEINKSLPGLRDVVANLANPEQLTALAKSFSTFAEVDGAKLSAAAPGIAEINKSLPGIKEVTAGLTDPVHLKALGSAFKEFELVDGPKLLAAGPGMKAINDALPGFGAILSGLTDPKHLKSLGVGFAEFDKINGTNLALVAPGVAAIGDALEGTLGGAIKSLLGVDSPIDKLASLGQIATPVTLAAEALGKLNPEITTLFGSIATPAFTAGVNAMNTMKNVIGGLDDNVNDWSDSELRKFKSITESMGQYAQTATGGPTPVGDVETDVGRNLKELVTKMETLITIMQESKTSTTEHMIKLVSATKEANPYR